MLVGDIIAVRIECDTAQSEDREISDGCARTIATWYQSPGMPDAAARFIASGEISDPADDVWRGLFDRPLYQWSGSGRRLALDMFCTYLLNRADRGPVVGWSGLWVR